MKSFCASEIAAWCDGCWEGDISGLVISGFSKDSRSINPGECYVALTGDNHDGHRFIDDAAGRGASSAVISEESCVTSDIPLLKVSDTCRALQQIAANYRQKIDPFVVGVTGSSGKTTVKEMIAACFSEKFRTVKTEGNLNNHIGVPMSLLGMEHDTECAVMEAGMNHPGELEPLCDILDPDWGVITNVGPVHLESFDSVEAVAREKAVLAEKSREMVFLDSDSKFFSILESTARGHVVTVSREDGADYVYSLTDVLKVIEAGTGECIDIELHVPGLHIAYDAALSAAVARTRGISWDSISRALSSFSSLPMRWEVHRAGGITLVDDSYNANPMSMRASIDAFLKEKPAGRKYLVLGDMLELGNDSEKEHISLGKWLNDRNIAGLITVGERAKDISASCGLGALKSVSSAEDVSSLLVDQLNAGDAVFFKGSRGIHLEAAVSDLASKLQFTI